MTITLDQLKGHVRLAVGGSPSTASGVTVDQRLVEIINAAGEHLFSRPWRFRERTAGGFDLTADQAYIDLTIDGSGAAINVGEILSIKSSDTLSFSIDLVVPAVYEEFVRSNAKTSLFYVATLTRTAQTSSGLPGPRLDVFPTPSGTTDNAVFIRYRESWPSYTTSSLGTEVAPVPAHCDQILIEMVRAIAEGGEDGTTHARLAAVDAGTLLDQALRKDGMATNDMGALPMSKGFFLGDSGSDALFGVSQPGLNAGYNLVWRGEWSLSTSYAQDDLSRYGGSVYIATSTSTNVTPTTTTHWDLFLPGNAAGSLSIAAGTGISASPDPITGASPGTISLSAGTSNLSDVNNVGAVMSGQVLAWNAVTSKFDPTTNFLGTQSSTFLSDVNTIAPSVNGQVLVWNSATSKFDPTTNFISTQATTNLSDVASAAATDTGQVLVFDAALSDWVPSNVGYVPAPGTEVATNEKAYSPTTSNYKRVYVQSWYQADNSSAPGGDITLIATATDYVVRWGGYSSDYNTTTRYSLVSTDTRAACQLAIDGSNNLVLKRGAFVDDTDDGYFVVVWYTRSADAGGTL